VATVTPKAILDGTLLGNSAATVYTATTTVTIRMVTFCNTDSSTRLVTMHVVQLGGSATTAKRVLDVVPLAAHDSIVYPGTEPGILVLETGDFIVAHADAASVVSIRIDGAEVS
jgi:hypothetical protein